MTDGTYKFRLCDTINYIYSDAHSIGLSGASTIPSGQDYLNTTGYENENLPHGTLNEGFEILFAFLRISSSSSQ